MYVNMYKIVQFHYVQFIICRYTSSNLKKQTDTQINRKPHPQPRKVFTGLSKQNKFEVTVTQPITTLFHNKPHL